MELAPIQVEARPALVGGEQQLGQAVTGEVAQRDAAAVVVVAIGEDVEVARLLQLVLEPDARDARGEPREQLVAGGRRGLRLRQVATAGRPRAAGGANGQAQHRGQVPERNTRGVGHATTGRDPGPWCAIACSVRNRLWHTADRGTTGSVAGV